MTAHSCQKEYDWQTNYNVRRAASPIRFTQRAHTFRAGRNADMVRREVAGQSRSEERIRTIADWPGSRRLQAATLSQDYRGMDSAR
jgi:hypothetical protein